MLKLTVLVVFLVQVFVVPSTNGWFSWWSNDEKNTEPSPAPNKDGRKAFYYGTTGLTCLLLHHVVHKRSAHAQEVSTWSYSHSFLYYDGYHFELGKDSHVYYDSSLPSDDLCHSTVGLTPSGYSSLSVNCLKNCSDNYIQKYGPYHFFKNNCHYYLNRMVRILEGNHCPAWCLED